MATTPEQRSTSRNARSVSRWFLVRPAGLLHSEKAEFHSIADCPIETEIVLIYKENAYFPESVKKFTDYLMTIK